MNVTLIFVICIGVLFMIFIGESKINSKKNEEFINKINEKIKQCPTIDEIFEKIKESNIGVLSISFIDNWSGPYSSFCHYDTTCLELDGKKKIISYNKEKFYEIYNRMIKELKNYNIQLIDSKTVRFNRIN
jgi:hypothetical protein